MGAVKLEHSDPAQHRACIMQQLRRFWMDDHLCDVVLKSTDGTEHHAHTAVLSAASLFFRNLLGGSFMEAERVQQKKPVEIAASKEVVFALLDYIYDGQPEVPVEVALELLRLAEAYNLPKLAGVIETGIRASLDGSVALQILQEAHGLHSLRAACEDKVAEEFETCSKHPDFLKLSANQLARILRRGDLVVSREEAVLKVIFAWIKVSKERHDWLGVLLQNADLQSLSMENLLRLGRTTLPGPCGDDLHREVDDASTSRKRSRSPSTFQPKRRRLQHWSSFSGASTDSIETSGREVLLVGGLEHFLFSHILGMSSSQLTFIFFRGVGQPPSRLSSPSTIRFMQWHKGEIYASDLSKGIFCWNPSDPASRVRRVAGEGAAVTGINDLGSYCHMSVSPSGEIFVSDFQNRRVLRFQSGSGDLVVGNTDAESLFCSPNGVLYVVSQRARTVQKLTGSTLETVIASENLPADKQFKAGRIFVTKEEVIYFLENRRILCINPAESLEPVVVGQIPTEGRSFVTNLLVTDSGTIYVADSVSRKVFAFHPSSPTFTEVLQCPDGLFPVALLIQDRSLYVSLMAPHEERRGRVYEYALPPDLQLP